MHLNGNHFKKPNAAAANCLNEKLDTNSLTRGWNDEKTTHTQRQEEKCSLR